MTRRKVTLAYISNDSERKASFKKRKRGLIKKVSELSTLCGVEACAIIYSQYEAEPEVWPSRLGAQAILARFRKLSDMDQCRKMVNQESFTRQRIKKAAEQLRRLRKENRCRELEGFMYGCIRGAASLDAFGLPDAADMGWVINQTLRDIKARMEAVAADHHRRQAAAAAAATAAAAQQQQQHLAELPRMDFEEGLECFPWNLVQSPTGVGAGEMDGGGLGWDAGMVLPYPYIFNHPTQSGNREIDFNH